MPYGYITALSDNLTREHVRYNNRYGIAIAADLYYAKDIDKNSKYPALIVGAPYGGTKEQGPCVYANELARRGFVVLTFDQVYMGESGGKPRNVSSPDLFAESFSAAVDYLGVKVSFVDREKIGTIGICGSGGFALSAASVDTRIKAIATASMYDITDTRGMMNLNKKQLDEMKDKLTRQRWIDFENGYPEYIPFFPEIPYPDVDDLPKTIRLPMNGKDFMLCHVVFIQMLVVVLLLRPTYQCFNLMHWHILMKLLLVQFFLFMVIGRIQKHFRKEHMILQMNLRKNM